MLVRAVILIALIALIDWRVETNVSLGFLYLFPMLMVGVSLNRWQIGIVGALVHVPGGGVRSVSLRRVRKHSAKHPGLRGVFRSGTVCL